MRWLKHRGGAQHHARWGNETVGPPACGRGDRRRSRHHPGRRDAGAETLSEYQFAGLLRGQQVELADCVSQPLKVPAEAEIVIEGEVSLSDYRNEGPYGVRLLQFGGAVPGLHDHRNLHAEGIRSIFRPIPPARRTTVGAGRSAEDEVFVPLIRQQFPEITDFWLPPEGCSYRIAVVSMKKAYPGP